MEYIFEQCELALQNLQTGSDSTALTLKSLEPAVVKQVEEIHNEVRCSALKMVWPGSERCSLLLELMAIKSVLLLTSIALYKFETCF